MNPKRIISVFALFASLVPGIAGAQVALTAVRVWPAPDYTRLTLESPSPLRYTLSNQSNPARLLLELQNVQPNTLLESLPARVGQDDPLIARAEVQRLRADGARIVLHLRAEARPQAFALRPVGQYAHRLVLDVYPAQPTDPLLALLQQVEAGKEAAAASTDADAQQAPEAEAQVEPKASASREAARGDGDATGKGSARAPAASTERKRSAANAKAGKPGRATALVVTVAIDAGHGGEDPGAQGRSGTREKDITLRIARKLKALVDAQPGMRAVLTRDGDYFVALHERVSKARQVRADLFVSIHADAFIRPDARGSSVFALSQRGATSAAARWLARRENEADLIGGVNLDVQDPYLRQTLLDLSQDGNIRHSIKLGQAVLQELGDINDLHKPRVEQAGFAVLKAPDIPSILVETAFISNPEEEKRLRNAKYQDQMATAILAGIRQYFADHPPTQREVIAANP